MFWFSIAAPAPEKESSEAIQKLTKNLPSSVAKRSGLCYDNRNKSQKYGREKEWVLLKP